MPRTLIDSVLNQLENAFRDLGSTWDEDGKKGLVSKQRLIDAQQMVDRFLIILEQTDFDSDEKLDIATRINTALHDNTAWSRVFEKAKRLVDRFLEPADK